MFQLARIVTGTTGIPIAKVSNTHVLHALTMDLCQSSGIRKGLLLSPRHYELLREVKQFSAAYIYENRRLAAYKGYAALVLESLYEVLLDVFCAYRTLTEVRRRSREYPVLFDAFERWLVKYTRIDVPSRRKLALANRPIYDIQRKRDYYRCVLDFLSGMTDSFALRVFEEITTF